MNVRNTLQWELLSTYNPAHLYIVSVTDDLYSVCGFMSHQVFVTSDISISDVETTHCDDSRWNQRKQNALGIVHASSANQ